MLRAGMQLNDWCKQEPRRQISPVYTFAFCQHAAMTILLYLLIQIIISIIFNCQTVDCLSYLLCIHCICINAVHRGKLF